MVDGLEFSKQKVGAGGSGGGGGRGSDGAVSVGVTGSAMVSDKHKEKKEKKTKKAKSTSSGGSHEDKSGKSKKAKSSMMPTGSHPRLPSREDKGGATESLLFASNDSTGDSPGRSGTPASLAEQRDTTVHSSQAKVKVVLAENI